MGKMEDTMERSRCFFRLLSRSLAATLFAMLLASHAQGATYPVKAITLICPFPPGGTMDAIARNLAEGSRKHLPKTVAVVNRAGGAGTIGLAEALQARPDGYTIAMSGPGPVTTQPHITDLPYKGPEDMAPVIGLAGVPMVLGVQANAPYKTMKEFLDSARANPGKLRIATSAIATPPNMAAQRLAAVTKTNIVIAPFTGGGEPVAALLGGHVDATLETTVTLQPQVQAGKVRLLATYEAKRTPSAPDVATLKEQGIDVVATIYYFIVAPKGTPDAIVATLHDAFSHAMREDLFVKFAANTGMELLFLSGKDLLERLKADFETDGKTVEQFGLRKK